MPWSSPPHCCSPLPATPTQPVAGSPRASSSRPATGARPVAVERLAPVELREASSPYRGIESADVRAQHIDLPGTRSRSSSAASTTTAAGRLELADRRGRAPRPVQGRCRERQGDRHLRPCRARERAAAGLRRRRNHRGLQHARPLESLHRPAADLVRRLWRRPPRRQRLADRAPQTLRAPRFGPLRLGRQARRRGDDLRRLHRLRDRERRRRDDPAAAVADEDGEPANCQPQPRRGLRRRRRSGHRPADGLEHIAADENGGIYIVTSKRMVRVNHDPESGDLSPPGRRPTTPDRRSRRSASARGRVRRRR